MTTLNQVTNDFAFAKEIEIQRLSWTDALFTTIKNDLASDDTYKAEKLADFGQYRAQDFLHYSEDDLAGLKKQPELAL